MIYSFLSLKLLSRLAFYGVIEIEVGCDYSSRLNKKLLVILEISKVPGL